MNDNNKSYWISSSKGCNYEKLNKNIDVEYLVVGGGITGVVLTYLLSKEGLNSTLVDANKICNGASGRNTGKATVQHDDFYWQIEKKHGIDSAKLYYKANNKALDFIEDSINKNDISCNFERLPSFVYTEKESYVDNIKREYETCKEIGIDCTYYNSLELPLDIKAAISFNNQAQFNPKQYIDSLANRAFKLGAKIYENTPIIDLKVGDRCQLETRDGYIIKANNVIIASHTPWYDGLNLFFAKESAERSYLLAYDLKHNIPKGMYINLEKPSRTFRTYNGEGKNLLIVGGGDHKVGQGKKEDEIYNELKSYASKVFNVKELHYKWSTQDYMSFDRLPFIGKISKEEDKVYVATGYSKWGMTNGVSAAMIIRDLIINKKSEYEEIFKPYRKGSFFTKYAIKENINAGINMISGKMNLGHDDMPIQKGEGKIVNIEGERYGAYRHFDNNLFIVDITCTHLGCELKFNGAEKTWDCPCHGSRFDYKGNVVEGPALNPLRLFKDGKNQIDPKFI